MNLCTSNNDVVSGRDIPRIELDGVHEEVVTLLDLDYLQKEDGCRIPRSPPGTTCIPNVSVPNKKRTNAERRVNGDDEESGHFPLRVLFLSSDTGGGHRASAESLFQQFLKQYPGSEREIVDFWPEHGWCCCRDPPGTYRFSSRNPLLWWIQYHVANWPPMRFACEKFLLWSAEQNIRRDISDIDPDVVVSVHPCSNYVPSRAVQNLSLEKGRYIPFFTVVTDYGSGHSAWFEPSVDKCYVASDPMRALARKRGVPDSKVVNIGLPIREEFDKHALSMGDRTTQRGQDYQDLVRSKLLLDRHMKVVLVMGGGEGYGCMADIVKSLYGSFSERGVDATIVAVCGRNDDTRAVLKGTDWDLFLRERRGARTSTFARLLFICFTGFASLLTCRRTTGVILWGEDTATSVAAPLALLLIACACLTLRMVASARWRGHCRSTLPITGPAPSNSVKKGDVKVEALGFVNNMAEYMVASDVLVSKAGPGTIAEATSLGLPIMLTSFMPGQEAGNVKVVVEKGFGAYCTRPKKMAEIVSSWLLDEGKVAHMSRNAAKEGNPACAAEIVRDIGQIVIDCQR